MKLSFVSLAEDYEQRIKRSAEALINGKTLIAFLRTVDLLQLRAKQCMRLNPGWEDLAALRDAMEAVSQFDAEGGAVPKGLSKEKAK